jgi:hypothetical protein
LIGLFASLERVGEALSEPNRLRVSKSFGSLVPG